MRTGIHLATALHRLFGKKWESDKLDRMIRDRKIARAILAGVGAEQIIARFVAWESAFRKRRRPFLLYR